ncbi:MAG: hypothetical protein ACK526_06995 [Planctomyces sp.]|jgi:hypothetical protein
MSRTFSFCTALFLTSTLSGCCLMHGMGGGYPGGGYYGGAGNGCGCAPTGYAPGGYPSAAMYGGATQAAYVMPTQTALAPLDPLPTR